MQFLKSEIGLDWYIINLDGHVANPVMRFEIDFRDTVSIADRLRLTIRVQKIGNSSFELSVHGEKETVEDRVVCFQATLVLAIVNLKEKRSLAIPEHWRRKLEAYQQAER